MIPFLNDSGCFFSPSLHRGCLELLIYLFWPRVSHCSPCWSQTQSSCPSPRETASATNTHQHNQLQTPPLAQQLWPKAAHLFTLESVTCGLLSPSLLFTHMSLSSTWDSEPIPYLRETLLLTLSILLYSQFPAGPHPLQLCHLLFPPVVTFFDEWLHSLALWLLATLYARDGVCFFANVAANSSMAKLNRYLLVLISILLSDTFQPVRNSCLQSLILSTNVSLTMSSLFLSLPISAFVLITFCLTAYQLLSFIVSLFSFPPWHMLPRKPQLTGELYIYEWKCCFYLWCSPSLSLDFPTWLSQKFLYFLLKFTHQYGNP